MDRDVNPSMFTMGTKMPKEVEKHFVGQAYLQPLTEYL